ncbi:PREDICTED: sodium- and chloride-dependent GABA transporter 2-like [Acropora digitifera]|uniref:sodium- and chloride-dependent GABA transporter 2-like n=1 Tax=Acropora digitifera TaxID=70779 RepID=UPI00077A5CE5|nr:PREDICTED: sodium- and chloride-dependent GABA transporter 2-like [Acropora digitifera]
MMAEVKQRETWSSKLDFLLALMGFSIGLGNIWRFPYLCFKNGGGCFLIPYLICLILAGVPVLVLEIAMGQFTSQGAITAWKMCPLFQGIGYAGVAVMQYVNIYYTVILGWSLYYMFASFRSSLPWSHCNNEWNTPNCVDNLQRKNIIEQQVNNTIQNVTLFTNGTVSNISASKSGDLVLASEEYWEYRVLRISSGLDQQGAVRWDLALCLLLAWVICYLCVCKGVKSSGKVVYFTATAPYVLLTVLLIRGVTLPGAAEGIKFYLTPNWSRLKDGQLYYLCITSPPTRQHSFFTSLKNSLYVYFLHGRKVDEHVVRSKPIHFLVFEFHREAIIHSMYSLICCCLFLMLMKKFGVLMKVFKHKQVQKFAPDFRYRVLRISSGLDQQGAVRWDLALCLLLAWVICYLCVCKGVKSSGKVVYFTATALYILLTVLLIRGVTLPGAAEGIKFYLTPNWSRLKDGQDKLKLPSNCFVCVTGVLLFILLFTFCLSGPGLAFIVYPEAVTQMPLAPLWSVLFFIMLFLLGLDSEFVGIEGVVTAIVDRFPQYLRRGYRKEMFTALVCVVWFLVGLSMVTEGGMYVFQLFDGYSGSGSVLLLVVICETLAIGWLYGRRRFYSDMERMLGFRINPWIGWCWCFFAPTFCAFIFIFNVATYTPLKYGSYVFPGWGMAIAWLLTMSSLLLIPSVMIYKLMNTNGTI